MNSEYESNTEVTPVPKPEPRPQGWAGGCLASPVAGCVAGQHACWLGVCLPKITEIGQNRKNGIRYPPQIIVFSAGVSFFLFTTTLVERLIGHCHMQN